MEAELVDSELAERGLAKVGGRNVAVIGSGTLALHHALCLRDTGIDVRLGLAPTDPIQEVARNEGLAIVSTYEACEEADLIVIAESGKQAESLYFDAVDDNLVPGDVVIVTDGYALRYESIDVPMGVHVALVALTTSTSVHRREFVAGRGTPLLVACRDDAEPSTIELAAGCALALGGPRATLFTSSLAHCADALALAQALMWGKVLGALLDTQQALEHAGVGPAVSYVSTLSALESMSEALIKRGPGDAASELDPWPAHVAALAGQRTDADILAKLADASLAQSFELSPQQVAVKNSPTLDAGEAIRGRMAWLRGSSGAGRRWR